MKYRIVLIAALWAFALQASTVTPLNPAPAGEVDLVDIVDGYCSANSLTCTRLFDDTQDQFWGLPTPDGIYITGFEDGTDRDGNDVVAWHVWTAGIIRSWGIIAEYSSATQSLSLEPLGGGLFALRNDPGPFAGTTIVSPHFSVQAMNPFNHDRSFTWGAPLPTEAPEPGALLLFGCGLTALAWLRGRR